MVRRTETQLLRMLLAQVILIIIFTLPLSIRQLYSSFSGNFTKTALQLAQESMAFRIASALTHFANTSTFICTQLLEQFFAKNFSTLLGDVDVQFEILFQRTEVKYIKWRYAQEFYKSSLYIFNVYNKNSNTNCELNVYNETRTLIVVYFQMLCRLNKLFLTFIFFRLKGRSDEKN
ncbi:unnamed protein product [Adineta ricciae]|uniref:Uncharacterized protein n=1 Tax=Adineta ricciae TaxID=249248 RepID=A0A815TII0_ADIRI|nr:unnamed protein product [Adineta ricciae]CAF1623673.1 unnamed protein product [Adineta ricciae]